MYEPATGYHRCPGGCGRHAPDEHYSCRRCWFRLPRSLRDRITRAWARGDREAHALATADAARVFLAPPIRSGRDWS